MSAKGYEKARKSGPLHLIHEAVSLVRLPQLLRFNSTVDLFYGLCASVYVCCNFNIRYLYVLPCLP